jgi:hypothetical protein
VAASVSAGLRQPCSAHARRNGVKTLYGSPSGLRTRPGVGRAGTHELPPAAGQRLLDGLVARAAVRAVVGGDVHGRGVHRGSDPRHDLGGITLDDLQLPAQRPVEAAQGPEQEGAAGRTGRAEQRGVQDEQRQRARRGGEEGGLVVDPQIPPEPDDGVLTHGARR